MALNQEICKIYKVISTTPILKIPRHLESHFSIIGNKVKIVNNN